MPDRDLPGGALLRDRSAVITGASRGLGQALARHFVEAGAGVLLVARSAERLAAIRDELLPLASGRPVEVFAGDVALPETAQAVAARVRERLADFAVLVNNAGVYGPLGPMETLSVTEWEEAVGINLLGTVYMCHALIPLLRQRGGGKIVNLSGGGATAPLPFFSAYAATKAAVVRLTETLAHELAPAHVDVNAIAPGPLNTQFLDQVLAAGPEKVGEDFYRRSLKQRDEGGVPLDKATALAVFLASARSDGISGRLLSALWDDWAALPEKRDTLAKSDVYTLRRIVPEDRGWK
jgi:3-oxoacyl-[acyl-carrier protein] reductase